MYSRCSWWLLAGLLWTGCDRYVLFEVPEEEFEQTLQAVQLEELAAGPGEVRRISIGEDPYWLAPGSWRDYCIEFEPDDYDLAVTFWSTHEWVLESYHVVGAVMCPRWWPAAGLTEISTVDTRRHPSSTAHTHPVRIFGNREEGTLYFVTGQGH